MGTVDLAIPKLRAGSYFPGWLEPRRRSEQALVGVVAEAYLRGVSTRKVEAAVQSLGVAGMSKSEVSRLCQSLDKQVKAFRTRRLAAEYPYIFLDARYEHVREDGRVQSMAVVIAYGVRRDGIREVLGLEVVNSEDLEVWRAFLQSLVARGVREVKLVGSDAHLGLKQAIKEVFVGSTWQRCRVHFLRNLLSRVPKAAQAIAAATVRPIFHQQSRKAAQGVLRQVCVTLEPRFPKVVELLGGGRRGSPGLLRLPVGALAADLQHQPVGAAEQGVEEAECGGGDLPEPGGGSPATGSPPRGAERRMAGAEALLQRRVDAQAIRALRGGQGTAR